MQSATNKHEQRDWWYLAYTDPRREAVALDHLIRQGYDAYLPLYGGREAMFPRYLFFRPATSTQSIAPVRSTRGVQTVVRFGDVYARIQSSVINGIRQQEALCRSSDKKRALKPGQRVRVQWDATPFAGLEGLVHSSASKRVVILMEILGRQTPVKLRAETLEAL